MSKKSPFDIEGVDLGLDSDEIVDVVREGRERKYSQKNNGKPLEHS